MGCIVAGFSFMTASKPHAKIAWSRTGCSSSEFCFSKGYSFDAGLRESKNYLGEEYTLLPEN
jgi:hypothetical protein